MVWMCCGCLGVVPKVSHCQLRSKQTQYIMNPTHETMIIVVVMILTIIIILYIYSQPHHTGKEKKIADIQ